MDSIDRIAAIADKIYLKEDFSQADLEFFYKYMKKAIPSWYPWNADDCISESILKMVDGYDINQDVWRKKKRIENMIRRVALTSIRDVVHYYEWEDKEDIISDAWQNVVNVNDKIIYDKIMNIIDWLRPLYSKEELEILDYHIIDWYPLIEIANRNNISLSLASLMKQRIVKRIQKSIDFLF